MSKKSVKKPAKRAVVKPPRVPPRQPNLRNRKIRKGNVLREETMRIEADEPMELGPRQLPEPDEAVNVLSVAADINDAALQAHKVYLELAKKAATAKKVWSDKVAEVQRHIRLSTHESTLPLLQEAEREADQAKMEEAIAAGGEL